MTEKIERTIVEWEDLGELHYSRDRGNYPRRDSHTEEEEQAFVRGYQRAQARARLRKDQGFSDEVEC